MIDFNKPIETVEGKKVRILCKDAKGPYPVVALIDEEDGERLYRYRIDGTRATAVPNSPSDLRNVPEKINISGWVNVYNVYKDNIPRAYLGEIYSSLKEALQIDDTRIIATKYISFSVTVGEGRE